jgi:hypothetical protein
LNFHVVLSTICMYLVVSTCTVQQFYKSLLMILTIPLTITVLCCVNILLLVLCYIERPSEVMYQQFLDRKQDRQLLSLKHDYSVVFDQHGTLQIGKVSEAYGQDEIIFADSNGIFAMFMLRCMHDRKA